MHGKENLKKNTITLYTENISSKKGTVKSIKNQSSLKLIINVVWFQTVFFSDLMLRSRVLKIFHAFVGVLPITEFEMKESYGLFKFTKNRHGILK